MGKIKPRRSFVILIEEGNILCIILLTYMPLLDFRDHEGSFGSEAKDPAMFLEDTLNNGEIQERIHPSKDKGQYHINKYKYLFIIKRSLNIYIAYTKNKYIINVNAGYLQLSLKLSKTNLQVNRNNNQKKMKELTI